MPSSASSSVVRFGTFEVDLRTRELRKNGVLVRLQEQPFQILAALLKRPGEMVTREELRLRLWPADTFVDFDNSVNAAVNRLREALGDSADNSRFVQTLPRRGYRFIAPVEAAASGSAIVATGPPPVTERGGRTKISSEPRIRNLGWWIGGAAISVALISLGIYGWESQRSRGLAAARINSLAVLPLDNLTGDPSQEYFADGMTDALITDLAQIKALRVISRTSAMQYKTAHKPLPQIARELKVDAVIEGTIVRSGSRVRIDAQLIEAGNDRHLWAGTYERDLRDIVALQGEVAEAIAGEVRVQITPREHSFLRRSPPVRPEAYDDYLRGRFFWNKRTEAGVRKSIEYFDRAAQEDPNFAPAFSGISDAYGLLGFYGAIPPKEAYPRAEASALKALKLDESLAEAHVSLGNAKLWFDWDWLGAEAEFKSAIELNPNYETAYRAYSNFLAGMCRGNEAIAMARKAQSLDPVSVTLSTHLGWIFFLTGHDDLAIDQLHKTLEADPHYARAHRDLAVVLAHRGQSEEAIREAHKAIELSESSPMMIEALGRAYASARQREKVQQVALQMKQQSKSRYVSPFYQAALYAVAGDKDVAFRLFETAYQERSSQFVWLNANPAFDRIRSDARFQKLVKRVGLPEITSPQLSQGPQDH